MESVLHRSLLVAMSAATVPEMRACRNIRVEVVHADVRSSTGTGTCPDALCTKSIPRGLIASVPSLQHRCFYHSGAFGRVPFAQARFHDGAQRAIPKETIRIRDLREYRDGRPCRTATKSKSEQAASTGRVPIHIPGMRLVVSFRQRRAIWA